MLAALPTLLIARSHRQTPHRLALVLDFAELRASTHYATLPFVLPLQLTSSAHLNLIQARLHSNAKSAKKTTCFSKSLENQ
jgi:hypothetical protein